MKMNCGECNDRLKCDHYMHDYVGCSDLYRQKKYCEEIKTIDFMQEILNEYFNVPNDTYAYNLTRVKEAFNVGTMSLEDFEEFDENTTRDLAEYLFKKGLCIKDF